MQKRIVNIVGLALAANLQPLPYRRNVASLSLLYKCYNGHYSKELASLVQSAKIHYSFTYHSIKPHPLTVTAPKCSKNSYSSSFFPRTLVLWNSIPSSYFPDSYNFQSVKSSFYRCFSR
ncbi:uncharacterized protein LOC136095585 [Hydra vulgaris]|uniref:uncharacterized protein LOC136095585 n=1 Tax=Hydra vulgaris TaxID=6087 RepID=UPI0032E9C757